MAIVIEAVPEEVPQTPPRFRHPIAESCFVPAENVLFFVYAAPHTVDKALDVIVLDLLLELTESRTCDTVVLLKWCQC